MALNLTMQPETLNTLAVNHLRAGRTWNAIELWDQYLHQYPKAAGAWNNLGCAYLEIGEHEKAYECLCHASVIDPAMIVAKQAKIMCMMYSDRFSQQEIEQEQHWVLEPFLASAVEPYRTWDNDRSARPLRIGYVSADLRTEHPVARFMQTLLANHTPDVHTLVYSTGQPDPTTFAMIVKHKGTWNDCQDMSDGAIAEMVRAQQVDILVDLGGHTNASRPLLFSRRPAPVSCQYLCYPGPPAQRSVDFYLTDSKITVGGGDPRSVFLNSYWCYTEPPYAPEISPSPLAINRHLTLLSINNFQKVNGETLRIWGKVMRSIPDARLLLHCPEGRQRDEALAQMGRISPASDGSDRVSFFARTASLQEYFGIIAKADLALDPIGFSGGTTTCDCLWMGVPVITCSGDRYTSRSARSILAAAYGSQFRRFCVSAPHEYVDKVSEAAVRIGDLRHGAYRDLLRVSPLMDAKNFALDIERAYRTMWERHWKKIDACA